MKPAGTPRARSCGARDLAAHAVGRRAETRTVPRRAAAATHSGGASRLPLPAVRGSLVRRLHRSPGWFLKLGFFSVSSFLQSTVSSPLSFRGPAVGPSHAVHSDPLPPLPPNTTRSYGRSGPPLCRASRPWARPPLPPARPVPAPGARPPGPVALRPSPHVCAGAPVGLVPLSGSPGDSPVKSGPGSLSRSAPRRRQDPSSARPPAAPASPGGAGGCRCTEHGVLRLLLKVFWGFFGQVPGKNRGVARQVHVYLLEGVPHCRPHWLLVHPPPRLRPPRPPSLAAGLRPPCPAAGAGGPPWRPAPFGRALRRPCPSFALCVSARRARPEVAQGASSVLGPRCPGLDPRPGSLRARRRADSGVGVFACLRVCVWTSRCPCCPCGGVRGPRAFAAPGPWLSCAGLPGGAQDRPVVSAGSPEPRAPVMGLGRRVVSQDDWPAGVSGPHVKLTNANGNRPAKTRFKATHGPASGGTRSRPGPGAGPPGATSGRQRLDPARVLRRPSGRSHGPCPGDR